MKYRLPVWGPLVASLLCVSLCFGQTNDTDVPVQPYCRKAAGQVVQEKIGSGTDISRASQIGPELIGKTVDISGTFTIDRDFTFRHCEVMLQPDAVILVEKGPAAKQERVLTLDGAKLYSASCNSLWSGIVLQDFTRLETRNDTRIEDARTAVSADGCAQLSLSYTTFDRNWIGVRLNPTADCLPAFTRLQGVYFTCTSDLNSDAAGPQSYAGIVTRNVPVVAGSKVGAINVNFIGLRFGILDESDNNMPLTIMGRSFRFRQIGEDGIRVLRGNIDLLDGEFENCASRAMNIRTVHRLNMTNARFRFNDKLPVSVSPANRTGIFVQNFAPGAQMMLLKSGFTSNVTDANNKVTGLWLDGKSVGAGTVVQVNRCRFDFTGERFFGIYINGYFPPQSRVQIYANAFIMEGLTATADANAIHCVNGDKNNLQIYDNDPFDGKPGGDRADTGIYLSGSSGTGNVVKDNVFPTDYSYFGNYRDDNMANAIVAVNFENTEYCGNDIGDCAVQFRMLGTNPGTRLTNNTMRGGSIPLMVEGYIGTQGTLPLESFGPHIASGNRWFRKFPFLKATAWAQCSGDCNLQPIVVHTDPSRVAADAPSWYPDEDINPDGWFVFDPKSSPAGCGAAEAAAAVADDRMYRAIADGTLQHATPAETAQLEAHLYDLLTRQPATAYAGYGRFLSRTAQTGTGQLAQVRAGLREASGSGRAYLNELEEEQARYEQLSTSVLDDTAATDRSEGSADELPEMLREITAINTRISALEADYQAALSTELQDLQQLNRSVRASTVYEENEKTVNDLQFRYLLDPESGFNEEQLAVLRSIAAQCAQEGGQAVYRARGLLPAEEQEFYTDVLLGCRTFEVPEALTESEEPVHAETVVSVFPNPAARFVNLRLPETAARAGFNLYDSTGRLVLEQAVSAGQTQVALDALPGGMYGYRVVFGSGETSSGKLVIAR